MSYLHLIFMSFMALFPVVNPIGSALISNQYMQIVNRRKQSLQIALMCFALCIVAAIAGKYILILFGVTIPIVRIVGGIVVAYIGWQSLNGASLQNTETYNAKSSLFYPIVFPITIGGGVLAVLFTLSAHIDSTTIESYVYSLFAIVSGIALNCIIIFIACWKSGELYKLNNVTQTTINKLIAFIVVAVGAQICCSGIKLL